MLETTAVIDSDARRRKLHLRRIRLRVVDGPDAGFEGVFEHDIVRIGTLPTSHVTLSDSTVSRSHAEIARTPQGILLRDKGSTNGTFIGPVRIKEVFLGDQRRFRVGKSVLEFVPADEVIDIVPAEQTEFEGLVGASVSMREVFSVLERVARTELTVLVTGETGTGKELVSRALHRRSARRDGPFVVFDCGAVPRNLVESELFGHERGAFTGAVAPRAGVFEQAHGGTIFLDELGELPLELQPALLRVLETRQVRRVGDRRLRNVDVRVVAATNRDLHELVRQGQFRDDLYYRVAVVEVRLPPLRERLEDFGLLVPHLLAHADFEHGVTGISPEVEEVFAEWHWPGNVRELRNVLLRALPFSDGPIIDLHALPEALRDAPLTTSEVPREGSVPMPGANLPLREAKEALLESFEHQYLVDLLERAEGNLSGAARLAGVDRKTVARMMKRHGLK